MSEPEAGRVRTAGMEPTYATAIALARVGFAALGLRLDVEGDERIPRDGPVLLAANHVSFLDFALVGLAARRSRRRVRFLARHDVWSSPAGAAMTAMRHVPVDPAAPAAAYLRARRLLLEGEAVGIFPEAGISTSYVVRGLMPGTAALAAQTGVPIHPVVIWGPQRIATAGRPVDLHRGRPITVRVGEPLPVLTGADPRTTTERLGAVLQRMLDEVQDRPEHRPRPDEPAGWHPAHLGGSAPAPELARSVERLPRSAVPPTWGTGARR
ncbi:lysophospholipid acyltransferase family protein [Nocardioides mesophilus]|uniref:1-acyl-sn-glycerol-3-phosphate acyltransferase n=1 Tax=Nocardioides mesophilus TaxID=433659 RepID=A0A7G9R6Z7_9ACTN|nr:lysophospholipid acyltransferase family protein [Nocardioides mesophilus]QNN51372.1 1-acyl-sn-glycerol-3-phosphate acyltransferase [Nocardioides mesophilus]